MSDRSLPDPKIIARGTSKKKKSITKSSEGKSKRTAKKSTTASVILNRKTNSDTSDSSDEEGEAKKPRGMATAEAFMAAIKQIIKNDADAEAEDELLTEIRSRLAGKLELPKTVSFKDLRILKEAWLWPLVLLSEDAPVPTNWIQDDFGNEEKLAAQVRRSFERAYREIHTPDGTVESSIARIMQNWVNIALTVLEWPNRWTAPGGQGSVGASASRLCDRIELWVMAAQKEIDGLDARCIDQRAGHRASSTYLRGRDTFDTRVFPLTASVALRKAASKLHSENSRGKGDRGGKADRKCNKCGDLVPPGTSFAAHRKIKKC
jgi:hypothetical protein